MCMLLQSPFLKSDLKSKFFKSDSKSLLFLIFVGTIFKFNLKSALVKFRNVERPDVETTYYLCKHGEKIIKSLKILIMFLFTRFEA